MPLLHGPGLLYLIGKLDLYFITIIRKRIKTYHSYLHTIVLLTCLCRGGGGPEGERVVIEFVGGSISP